MMGGTTGVATRCMRWSPVTALEGLGCHEIRRARDWDSPESEMRKNLIGHLRLLNGCEDQSNSIESTTSRNITRAMGSNTANKLRAGAPVHSARGGTRRRLRPATLQPAGRRREAPQLHPFVLRRFCTTSHSATPPDSTRNTGCASGRPTPRTPANQALSRITSFAFRWRHSYSSWPTVARRRTRWPGRAIFRRSNR